MILQKKIEINNKKQNNKRKSRSKSTSKDEKEHYEKEHKHHHHHHKKYRTKDINEKDNRRDKDNKRDKGKDKNKRSKSKEKDKYKKSRNKEKEKNKDKTKTNEKSHHNNNNHKKTDISFPPKKEETMEKTIDDFVKKQKKSIDENDKNDNTFVVLNENLRCSIINGRTILLNEQELNVLDYALALKTDKRTYWQYYWSLVKSKHIILFTFLTRNDYNIKTIKISLFIFSFSLYFTLNGFFFTDSTMHKVYKDKGAYKIIVQIPIMAFSTLISILINFLLRKISLTQQKMLDLKRLNNMEDLQNRARSIINCIKIKQRIFVCLSFIFLLFFWYYLTCFCGVYINTQVILIKDTLISFCLSMVYPFIIYLIPGLFRIPALRDKNKNRECLYKASLIIAYF